MNLLWGGLASALWCLEQYLHALRGETFSGQVFLKGLALIGEAALICHLCAPKGRTFLGLFPLCWLAVSRFQWVLCSHYDSRYWGWLALFLATEALILILPDGKKMLWVLAPLWAGLIRLLPLSFFLPLAFSTAPPGRFKHSAWIRWGGIGAAFFFALFFGCWNHFRFSWLDLYGVLVEGRLGAFLILGWLGLAAYDPAKKGAFRHMMAALFLVCAGFLFWNRDAFPFLYESELLRWILVFMGGFGLEAFRKDVIDPSWHGRALWFALGLAFFGGVL
jgi:hypothetical protein